MVSCVSHTEKGCSMGKPHRAKGAQLVLAPAPPRSPCRRAATAVRRRRRSGGGLGDGLPAVGQEGCSLIPHKPLRCTRRRSARAAQAPSGLPPLRLLLQARWRISETVRATQRVAWNPNSAKRSMLQLSVRVRTAPAVARCASLAAQVSASPSRLLEQLAQHGNRDRNAARAGERDLAREFIKYY